MSHFCLIEAVQMEGLGRGRVVAPALGDVQVTGVLDGRDDRGADGGQVGWPAAGPASRGIFAESDIPYVLRGLCARDLAWSPRLRSSEAVVIELSVGDTCCASVMTAC